MADFSPRGTFTALVTPFTPNGEKIDWSAQEQLIAAQMEAGIDAVVPCGTTGESPTLSASEKSELISRTVEHCNGRAAVLAGIGSSDTRSTVSQAEAALAAGADALMLVMPAYSRPSQNGLVQHVETVARAAQCPLVLYNIPGRTGVNLQLDTIEVLLERVPNIVALKDATGSVPNCQSTVARFGDRLSVLSGDDSLTLAMMAVGAQGVISVTANVLPQAVAAVVQAALRDQFTEARSHHTRLLPVHEAMSFAPSPGPIKAALAHHELLRPVLRPPMDMPSEAEVAKIVTALRAFES